MSVEQKSNTNKNYKDTVFRMLFNDELKALELYNAITGNDYSDVSKLKICTLEDVLFTPRKNDLAFTVDDKFVLVVEHQSSVNENMPLRMLLYLAREYEKIVDTSNIYKQTLIKLPTPELIVLYNGLEEQPLEKILKLSDAFKGTVSENFVELKVKLINIKYKNEHKILSKSENLRGYSYLVYKIQSYIENGANRDKAIKSSISDCIKENVLREFLKTYSTEVFNMLTAEYDLDTALKVSKEEGMEIGREKGKLEGEYNKALEIAKNLIDILDINTISEKTGLSIDIIRKLIENRDGIEDISTNPYQTSNLKEQ